MGILDVLKSIGNGIGNFAKNAVNTVKGAISSVFNTGKETVNKILDIPKAAITTAGDLGGKITQTIGGAVHDVSGGLSSIASSLSMPLMLVGGGLVIYMLMNKK